MIQALVTDFSWVLLFPAEKTYSGTLNGLYKEKKDYSDFDFFHYFVLNQELLDFYNTLNIPRYIFTSGYVQEDPPVAVQLKDSFKEIWSASRLGVHKSKREAYSKIIALLDLEPRSILFVDDDPINIAAAQEEGLQTILYQSNEQVMQDITNILHQ